MERSTRRMSKSTKRTLVIVGTIIGAVGLALLIAFIPSCGSEEEEKIGTGSDVVVGIPGAETGSTDYDSMSKEELIKELEARDAEIARLKNLEETYTDVKDVQIGVITGGGSSGGGSSSSKDSSDTSTKIPDDEDEPSSGSVTTKPDRPVTDTPSTDVPSTDEPDTDVPSTGAPETGDPATSDTGL